ncbi:hypothetical protein [Pendulispora albinea]|uniref:Uncharacterized protein n=1 Tax=Pendulispora albinea TaxID=2741071 RepID=A0ABZ2M873_9BACT
MEDFDEPVKQLYFVWCDDSPEGCAGLLHPLILEVGKTSVYAAHDGREAPLELPGLELSKAEEVHGTHVHLQNTQGAP